VIPTGTIKNIRYLHVFDILSAEMVFCFQVSESPVIRACYEPESGGALILNKEGVIRACYIYDRQIAPHILVSETPDEQSIVTFTEKNTYLVFWALLVRKFHRPAQGHRESYHCGVVVVAGETLWEGPSTRGVKKDRPVWQYGDDTAAMTPHASVSTHIPMCARRDSPW